MARPAKAPATVADTKEAKAPATVADSLIVMAHPMYDDIRVHPTQIDGWKAQDWQVVE